MLSWGFWLGSPLASDTTGCQGRGFLLYIGHGGRVSWGGAMKQNGSCLQGILKMLDVIWRKQETVDVKTYKTGHCKSSQYDVHGPTKLLNNQPINESNHLKENPNHTDKTGHLVGYMTSRTATHPLKYGQHCVSKSVQDFFLWLFMYFCHL